VKRDADIEWVEEMEDEDEPERMKKHMYNLSEENSCRRMQLAHAYVPWQCYDEAFSPQEALMKGTLFPSLYGVYPIPN
jgi:hypothetical protein